MTAHDCRFCGASPTTSFADLGATPLANNYLNDTPEALRKEHSYPLHARVCGSCFLVQIDTVVPASEIFNDQYAYFSSFSDGWLKHAKAYSEQMIDRFGLATDSLVIEIASNDGYLLRNFTQRGIPVLGIEPAGNVAEAANKIGVRTKVCFFHEDSARELAGEGFKADLVAANNVLAHVPDIRHFMAGFPHILKPEGVITFEFPHLLNLIEKMQFDTIYHEHYSYLSLLAVEKVLDSAGLRAFDVEELPTHGGSLRLFACHKTASHQPQPGLEAVQEKEQKAGLDRMEVYKNYGRKLNIIRTEFMDFLRRANNEKAQIAAYGAAAKGNTFLNYCGVGPKDISFVVDRNPAKQNRLLPGSHIPVRAPEALLAERPDYVIILPWNLSEEISREMAHISEWGGRFVTAIPRLKIFAPSSDASDRQQ